MANHSDDGELHRDAVCRQAHGEQDQAAANSELVEPSGEPAKRFMTGLS